MAQLPQTVAPQLHIAGATGFETKGKGSKQKQQQQEIAREDLSVEMATWADDSEDVTAPLIVAESASNEATSGDPVFTVEDAIEHVGFGKYQLILGIYVGLTWVADAAEMILLSFIGPAAQCEWQLSPSQEGAVSSAVFAGVFVGAYAWGLLADTRGRRVAVLTTAVFTSVFGVLSALSPSFLWLLISRALVGFGLGGTVVVYALLMEFLPVKRRGFWLVSIHICWTVGSIAEALLAWLIIPRTNWRWLVGVSALPFVFLLLFYPLVPESPRYLMVKGDVEGTMQALRKISKANRKSLPAGRLIPSLPLGGTLTRKVETLSSEVRDEQKVSLEEVEKGDVGVIGKPEVPKELGMIETIQRLFSPELRRTTLLLWFLYFANSLVYYGLVLLTTQLDIKDGKSHRCDDPSPSKKAENICHDGKPLYDDTQYRTGLISSIAEVPGVIVACLVVDHFGRKMSLAGLLVACGAFMIPLVSPLSEMATNFFLFGARSCSMGAFSVLWAYAPELYYTQVRSTGVGAANSNGRLGGIVCPYVAVALIESCQRMKSIFLFAFFAMLAGVATFFFPRENKMRKTPD
ncbi:MFS transporter, VNT family, synaptic vesicle glycoprotein 2 [Marchantia polymorpha subsp. ruderalis]|uniref:Major facilitator superfamily (MFS) profile domain-containing protein n=2 Tax=Marchantia polymorpha TaxID=3197 RepID=A0AAF6BJE6_MARPO|nr:hypothetical protein MARPO_0084s0014 [Marchantia polymorpha]BBN12130.1 hypothetical protein Mp_5g17620 [Marchantia polymorpha subsp. ruderalis]|eukprot:PTQ33920.1 hypothetical protein MARPO_0084s0014 [Marchantia polymorpha]